MKSDGRGVRSQETVNDRPAPIRIVVNPSTMSRITIDPMSESTTTYGLRPDEVQKPATCEVKSPTESATMLGFRVFRTEEHIQAGPRTYNVEKWVAPLLACLPLKTSYQVMESRTLKGSTTDEIVALKTGDPDETLFAVPNGYTERPPLAVIAERLRLLGKPCPECMKSAGQQSRDRAYYSRRHLLNTPRQSTD